MYEAIMRFFSLAVLGILTGVLGTEGIHRTVPEARTATVPVEDLYRYYAHENCQVYTLYPDPFPSNEEELQNACSNLATIEECIAKYIRSCSEGGREVGREEGHEEEHPNQEYRHYRGEDELERERNRISQNLKDYQRLIDITTDICQEESVLHASFVQDMACYREIFDKNNKDQICRNYTTNALNYLRSRIDRMRPERREEFNKLYLCLRILLDMNCFVEQFNKKCSSQAKDTALEIIEKAGSLYYQCPVSFRIDILKLLDDLKLVTREDIYVRQLLETDSFF